MLTMFVSLELPKVVKTLKDIVAGMMVAPAASSEVQHGEVVSPPAEMVWSTCTDMFLC